jgi:phenylpyruvate tautomerase PptA (4-oxalocrotonate tautomerase family)
MPILAVEIVLKPGEVLTTDIATRIADAAGKVLASRPRGTWVKVRALDSALYAENGGGSSLDVFPVFVSVLKSRIDADNLKEEASRLAESIAGVCNRPKENVHIIYEPEARGRIAFGGILGEP